MADAKDEQRGEEQQPTVDAVAPSAVAGRPGGAPAPAAAAVKGGAGRTIPRTIPRTIQRPLKGRRRR